MRTTIDIPDAMYRSLKMLAAERGTTVREIVQEGLAMRLRSPEAVPRRKRGPRFPVIRSKNPGSLKLAEEGVYEYIPFP